jgi:hypothetical protein
MSLQGSLIASSLLALASPAFTQTFSFGAKVGVPLTSAYQIEQVPDGGASSYEYRVTLGPTFGLHLYRHLSLEVDALWRRSSFSWGGGFGGPFQSSVNDWQFPVVFKYSIKSNGISPFIDAGGVYRRVSTVSSSVQPPNNPSTAGLTAGAGVTLRLLHLRVSPEIRYTWWSNQAFSPSYHGFVTTRSNQADLLIGATF